MGREPWYDSNNPSRVARGASWRIALWVVGIVAFTGLLAGGVWAVKVATSDVRGAGDQAAKVNSANNRIFAQEHFFTLYNNLLAYDQQLDQAAKDKTEHPGDVFFATNYSGLVKTCIDARNQYNADANKVTQAKWRDPQRRLIWSERARDLLLHHRKRLRHHQPELPVLRPAAPAQRTEAQRQIAQRGAVPPPHEGPHHQTRKAP